MLFISFVNGRQYTFRGKRGIADLENFIEGGYVSVESTEIPSGDYIPPDSDIEELIYNIQVWKYYSQSIFY